MAEEKTYNKPLPEIRQETKPNWVAGKSTE